MKRPPIERVADRCVFEDRGYATPCRIFSGAKDQHGYGMITVGKTTARAHIVTYEHSIGPVPKGLELDHLCRQNDCCNPLHLEAVTHAENVRRGRVSEATKARCAEVTHCPQGHEYTPENTRTKKHRDGYLCRACRACHRADSSLRYHRSRAALIAGAVIFAALLVPALAGAASPTPKTKKLAPPTICTMANRMTIFVDEDRILYECTCEVLSSGFICRWQVIGGVDAIQTRRFIKKHPHRVTIYALPRVTA